MAAGNLAKNTSFFTVALALQKALSFGYVIILARALSVADVGRLSFALSFSTIFAMLLDFGLTQVLIRESARDHSLAQRYLAQILAVKTLGSIVVYLVMLGAVMLMQYPPLTQQLVAIAGLVMVVDSFSVSLYGMLRGRQTLVYESIGVVLNQVIVMIVGLTMVGLGGGVRSLIAAYLIGSFANIVMALRGIWRHQIHLQWQWSWPLLRQIGLIALPFAMAGLFMRIYSSLDVVMLSKLAGDHEVGLYSVAYKIAFSLQFVAIAFSATIYPAFCRLYVESREKLADNFIRSIEYLLIISLPIAVGVMTTADKVVGPIFGQQYLEAVPILTIMMISLVFSFLVFAIGALLNASNRQSRNTIHLAVAAGTNALINAVLIPFWGAIGAAWATVITYGLLCLLGWVVVPQIISFPWRSALWQMTKVLVAALLMGAIVLLVKPFVPIIATIGIGGVVYAALLWLSGVVSREDATILMSLVRRKDVPTETV